MNNYLSPAELLASYSAAGVRKMERSAATLYVVRIVRNFFTWYAVRTTYNWGK